MKYLFILIALILNAHAEGFFNEKSKGWHWYQRAVGSIKDKEDVKPTTARQTPPTREEKKPKTAKQRMNEIREELEEALSVAILDPTPAHVRTYQRLQQRWVNQSQLFSKVWMRNLIQHPSMDETVKNPTTQFGIQVKQAADQLRLQEKIHAFSKTHGLFFFYQGKCKFCQAMAQILLSLREKYGWHVVGISQDGTILPEFPDSKKENGISEAWGIQGVPAIFVVQPDTEVAKPIAYGLQSLEQIELNLVRQLDEERTL